MKVHPRFEENTNHGRYLNILSKVAVNLSNYHKTRVAACVVYEGDVVAFGSNELKSHPFQARFSRHPDAIYLHAETAAIKNALKFVSSEDLKQSTLYIARVKYYDCDKRKLVFGLARPCAGCARCIETFGIPEVVYSTEIGFEVNHV